MIDGHDVLLFFDATLARFPFALAYGIRTNSWFERVIHRAVRGSRSSLRDPPERSRHSITRRGAQGRLSRRRRSRLDARNTPDAAASAVRVAKVASPNMRGFITATSPGCNHP